MNFAESVAKKIRDFKISLGGKRYEDDFPDKLSHSLISALRVDEEKLGKLVMATFQDSDDLSKEMFLKIYKTNKVDVAITKTIARHITNILTCKD
jgi:hypothetical protein